MDATAFGSPSTGAWYFVVGWHDAVNNVIEIQVNNGARNSLSWSGGVFDGNAGFEIGGRNDTQPGYFDGRIDEVGLWKRVLGGDEKTFLYRNGSGCQYAFSSCNLSSFVYDGDGQRVQSTENGTVTTYIGNYYEWNGTAGLKYYYAGGQRVAMRNAAGTLYFLLGDQLGSTSVVADAAGNLTAEQMYEPWGAVRYSSGTIPTSLHFTGQHHDGYNQLHLMGARWYDPWIGRFASADTIVPGTDNAQALNRYSYSLSNPLRYTDPSGHCPWCVVIGAVILILKVVDYGWTGYDIWQAGKILNDPNASQAEKDAAALSMAASVAFEAAEPDDASPIGLPLDDLARHGIMEAGEQLAASAGREAAEEAIEAGAAASLRNFADPGLLTSHFNKHASEFGYTSVDQYIQGARTLTAGGEGIQTFTRHNGDRLFYNAVTNEFAVISGADNIRTYFKPKDGLDYWLGQIGQH